MPDQEKKDTCAEIENRISRMLRSNKMTHYQQTTQLRDELKKAPRTKISLGRAFNGTRFIMDQGTLLLLTHPAKSYISPRNPNFHENIFEILERQIDLDSIVAAYRHVRASISQRDAYSALQFVAKKSRNVLVWTFLTSVLEWNIGTNSLRFIIKEQNSMFSQDEHQKYLLHNNVPTHLSEKDLLGYN